MKTQDVKRGITSPHIRHGVSSPDLGRISRSRDSVHEAVGVNRRRRSRPPMIDKRTSAIWLILLGGGALAIIGGTILFWLMPRMRSEANSTVLTGAEVERDERVESKFPSPSREESLEIVQRALAVRDPAEVKELFRVGESSPAEIVAFLQAASERDGEVENYEWMSSMDKDGLLIEGVLVRCKGQEKPLIRLALLTPDDAGVWKLDFDAYARVVEPGWQELLEKGARRAVVRVTVMPDVYYNGPFSDDKEWVCYGIVSPDVNETLRGYCRVGSPQAEAMARLFKYEEKASRATLEIRRVKSGGPKQFEIVRLLGGEWVIASNP
ncbi:MAG: hypothetical protein EOP85_00565 [Verrucomicrobiaceae bacterium]|nr:MAG: hypothetical protein EOP85_00565 [Verrucomicrobiaceae bacterium]